MKRDIPVGVGHGTHHGEAGMFIEQTIAYNEGRTPTFLFVAGLGVERDNDEITLLRNVNGHLPFFFPDGSAPLDFFDTIVFGHFRH